MLRENTPPGVEDRLKVLPSTCPYRAVLQAVARCNFTRLTQAARGSLFKKIYASNLRCASWNGAEHAIVAPGVTFVHSREVKR